jgi:hypothetical protein
VAVHLKSVQLLGSTRVRTTVLRHPTVEPVEHRQAIST